MHKNTTCRLWEALGQLWKPLAEFRGTLGEPLGGFGSTKNVKLWQNQFDIEDIRKSSARKLRWAIYYTLYRVDPQTNYKNTHVCTTNSKIQKIHGLASIWEHQKNVKLWQKQKAILCKRYREILSQKVALGYLLHFVQNGSSNNIFEHICLHNKIKHQAITRPGFHLGAQTKT